MAKTHSARYLKKQIEVKGRLIVLPEEPGELYVNGPGNAKPHYHVFKTDEELKHCPGCNKWLPLSAYSVNKRSRDGYSSYCRRCNCIASTVYQQKRFERLKKELDYIKLEYVKKVKDKKLTSEELRAELLYLMDALFDYKTSEVHLYVQYLFDVVGKAPLLTKK
jgi:hypothetical protein